MRLCESDGPATEVGSAGFTQLDLFSIQSNGRAPTGWSPARPGCSNQVVTSIRQNVVRQSVIRQNQVVAVPVVPDVPVPVVEVTTRLVRLPVHARASAVVLASRITGPELPPVMQGAMAAPESAVWDPLTGGTDDRGLIQGTFLLALLGILALAWLGA